MRPVSVQVSLLGMEARRITTPKRQRNVIDFPDLKTVIFTIFKFYDQTQWDVYY